MHVITFLYSYLSAPSGASACKLLLSIVNRTLHNIFLSHLWPTYKYLVQAIIYYIVWASDSATNRIYLIICIFSNKTDTSAPNIVEWMNNELLECNNLVFYMTLAESFGLIHFLSVFLLNTQGFESTSEYQLLKNAIKMLT